MYVKVFNSGPEKRYVIKNSACSHVFWFLPINQRSFVSYTNRPRAEFKACAYILWTHIFMDKLKRKEKQ